jgi:hypothetical protein
LDRRARKDVVVYKCLQWGKGKEETNLKRYEIYTILTNGYL